MALVLTVKSGLDDRLTADGVDLTQYVTAYRLERNQLGEQRLHVELIGVVVEGN